ncbi:hypothetical protein CQ017_15960 [Arthrobacter sp. MYb224]|uniref:HTTM domain-containing protein n=1 Tax=unclassified Arthrobacter TaxID=235627 RepID=UPI000CFB1E5A|nr:MULTISPECIES: HTTM domain-containing protein [unclassified Arthrobacter]PQZ96878.1 hypothetical protein CQ017_15960 [Arthrobacter sp. MYb224]PQZ97990.1 hypothetical protein CQ019_17315 [Arthrobacter sp. MYb229]PRB46872.1 hypothetical protein CQ013_17340 [Arthrobacter sp. MYb216]
MISVTNKFGSWLLESKHSLISFSLLRIIYGIGMLTVLVPSFTDRSLLWGPASWWVDPEAKRRGYWTFDTVLSKSNELFFDIGYVAFIVLVLIFIAGWKTRYITPLILLMLVALQSNNSYLTNGGDTLGRITLLFLIFANLSEYFSVDSWLRRRKTTIRSKPKSNELWNLLHNIALLLCMTQIVIVYLISSYLKLIGENWIDGTGFFYAMNLQAYQIYPMINELLWQSSLFIKISSWLTLIAQGGFVFFVIWRKTRPWAVAVLFTMHVGIAALLAGLWQFSLVMIALDLLFISNREWVSIRGFINTKVLRKEAIEPEVTVPDKELTNA